MLIAFILLVSALVVGSLVAVLSAYASDPRPPHLPPPASRMFDV